jgi:adenine phosphoribosyltransferase
MNSSEIKREGDVSKYPNLTKDIQNAPKGIICGEDGKSYLRHVFSFGEYGTFLEHELTREIADGLVEKIRPLMGTFDYMIALMPRGGPFGMIVAENLGVNLTFGWKKIKGLLYEIVLEDEFRIKTGGPHGKELCFRGINEGDRLILVDDVISTGENIKAVIRSLKQRNVTVVGVFSIVTKGEGYKKVETSVGVSITSLMNLGKDGRILRWN